MFDSVGEVGLHYTILYRYAIPQELQDKMLCFTAPVFCGGCLDTVVNVVLKIWNDELRRCFV